MSESALIERNVHSHSLFGIEFIWQLQDCYEQKNLEKIISLISLDFQKDPFLFKERLGREFNEYEQLKLFIHLQSKCIDADRELHSYEICWSKRCKRYHSIFVEKDSGRATIMLKKFAERHGSEFLLYDIQGKNPFI